MYEVTAERKAELNTLVFLTQYGIRELTADKIAEGTDLCGMDAAAVIEDVMSRWCGETINRLAREVIAANGEIERLRTRLKRRQLHLAYAAEAIAKITPDDMANLQALMEHMKAVGPDAFAREQLGELDDDLDTVRPGPDCVPQHRPDSNEEIPDGESI